MSTESTRKSFLRGRILVKQTNLAVDIAFFDDALLVANVFVLMVAVVIENDPNALSHLK